MSHIKNSLCLLLLIFSLPALAVDESYESFWSSIEYVAPDAPQLPLNSEFKREYETPLYCTGEQQCQQMWQRTAEFVDRHTNFSITTHTETLIETSRPSYSSQQLHFSVKREDTGDGRYEILIDAGCSDPNGCIPNYKYAIVLGKLYIQTGLIFSPQMLSGTFWGIRNQVVYDYAERLERLSQQDVHQLLDSDRVVNCELDETTRTQLIYQVMPDRLALDRARKAADEIQHLDDSVTVVSGNCVNGQLEGAFSARFRHSERTPWLYGTYLDKSFFGRVDGYLDRGLLHGEVRTMEVEVSAEGDSKNTEVTTYGLGVFEQGREVGVHLGLWTMRFKPPRSTQNMLTVTEVLAPGLKRNYLFLEGDADVRFYTLNGEREGWVDHANPSLQDMRDCFKADVRQSSDEYCEQIAASLELGVVTTPSEPVMMLPQLE